MNYLGLLSHGATVQLHTQNAFDESPASVAVISELNAFTRTLKPWLAGSRVKADAALLDWADPREPAVKMAWGEVSRHADRIEFQEPDDRTFLTPVGNVRPGSYLDDSLRGYWRALREHHVPVRVVSADDIREGGLAGIPSLVLANAERIDDATAEAIRGWVEAGGGLVLTYRSGWRDGAGVRRQGPGLAGLAGVRGVFGEATHPIRPAYVPHDVSPPQVYYRVTSGDPAWAALAGRLSSFMGSYVEFDADPEAQELATIVDFDYSRMHPEHTAIGWYPWKPVRPMAVGRDVGKGRVVYLGAEIDGASLRFGDPESLALLVAAVRWASRGSSSLAVSAPPSVEVVAHESASGDRWAVLLVNQTTNQHYPDPVRYIVPVHDVAIRLRVGSRRVMGIETANGGRPAWKQEGEWLAASLPLLATYEALLVSARAG
jgi:type 1 glutamine amidotransferase